MLPKFLCSKSSGNVPFVLATPKDVLFLSSGMGFSRSFLGTALVPSSNDILLILGCASPDLLLKSLADSMPPPEYSSFKFSV